jgi:GT2 family glycosyltransferase
MTKTLAIILNHNLPEYTNLLYYSLSKFRDETFDLKVMDNGSRPELVPKYAHIKFKKNLFWGGALNEAFKLVLQNKSYDSLLFLNNDIELTPNIFISSLRRELFSNDFAIVSPCIAGRPQPWRQMQNWGSRKPRVVKWIDNQAPLFHRKIIEAIRQFPEELYIGWGQDMMCYDFCRDNNWKIAVCDYICILHYGKQTLYQNQLYSLEKDKNAGEDQTAVSWEAYKEEAMKTRDAYFATHPLKYESFDRLVEYGLNYQFTQPERFWKIIRSRFPGVPGAKPIQGSFIP